MCFGAFCSHAAPTERDRLGIWGYKHVAPPEQEELSDAPDFFEVWHVHHFVERRPDVAKYLDLAPDEYEDVWFDSKLLEL